MAYCDPPKHTRFPVNRQPHTQKHPNGYLTPILKKLLNKKMTIKDSEVKRVLDIKAGTKAELKKIIMLRYILNAVQGENTAIEGIFDRIDGKLKSNGSPLIDQSQHSHLTIKIVKADGNNNPPARETNRGLREQVPL